MNTRVQAIPRPAPAHHVDTLQVSVVVPTLNEERNLPAVFSALPERAEIIVVDGGSADRTVDVARELRPDSKIIQQTRKGKGNALACGFAAATGDVIVMIDADGSTDPHEIPRFIEAIAGGADFAKGSRFRDGGHSDDITPLRRLGNYGLNALVNVLMGTRFTDMCYGYNAFRRDVLADMNLPRLDLPAPPTGKLWGDGFEIETLINMRVAAAGNKIKEVPSIEAPRQYGESNLNAATDGLRVLRTIITEYLGSRRRARANRKAARNAPATQTRTASPSATRPGRAGTNLGGTSRSGSTRDWSTPNQKTEHAAILTYTPTRSRGAEDLRSTP